MLSAPLRVAVLCSHRAPGLAQLIDDARHGPLYEIACCLTTEEAFEGHGQAQAAGIPCVTHPIRRFYAARGARLGDAVVRAAYDEETAGLLAPFGLDLVVLSSYLFILTRPMLAAFRGRLVNVHHSDLTIPNGGGRPRYVGLRAVRDAILAGEPETRATAHLVTEELDAGPPLLRSWAFPVARPEAATDRSARDVLKTHVFVHQEWMLRRAWGPLMAGAIEILATTRIRTTDRCAWIDGVPGPWDLRVDGTVRPGVPLEAGARES